MRNDRAFVLAMVVLLGVEVSVLAQEREVWSTNLEVGYHEEPVYGPEGDVMHRTDQYGYRNYRGPGSARVGDLTSDRFWFRGVQHTVAAVYWSPAARSVSRLTISVTPAPPFRASYNRDGSVPDGATVTLVIDGRRFPLERSQRTRFDWEGSTWGHFDWYRIVDGFALDDLGWTVGQRVRLSLLTEAEPEVEPPPEPPEPDPFPTPEDLTASAGDESIRVAWSAVEGAVEYSVEWWPRSGGGGMQSATTTDTTYEITGLVNGIPVVVWVAASDGDRWSGRAQAEATPAVPAPAVPAAALALLYGALVAARRRFRGRGAGQGDERQKVTGWRRHSRCSGALVLHAAMVEVYRRQQRV